MKIGRTIKALRITQGKTQQEVADAAKVDMSYIGMIERDERSPRLDTLKRLAKALNTTPQDILAAEESLGPPRVLKKKK